MKNINLNLLSGVLAAGLTACSTGQQDFNEDWEFWSDSQPERQMVDLPHDAMQTETRSADVPEGRHNGFYPGNIYHYEKTFNASADMLQKHVTLKFDGVYRNSKVLVNGQEAGGYLYGYMPFEVCLDGLLKAGENVIRVDVDNSEMPNSRWYSGAGIYRPVTLCVQEKDYIEEVRISTLSIAPAKVAVQTSHQGGEISVSIFDGNAKVAEAEGDKVELSVDGAKLWSAEHPNLYTAVVELKKDGKTIEVQEKRFGIRQISWNAQDGLLVNGEKVLLKGGCIHHDNGVLGAAEYKDADLRKVGLMKQYGFNALRISHNPASEALLEACDELGMYVMDELWDMWYITKTQYDYSNYFRANYQEDLRRFVAHDYNHPSVIMYSIGNEVGEPAQEEGLALAKDLIARLHQEDASRPVTAGINIMIVGLTSMGRNLFETANSAQMGGDGQMTSEQYNQMMVSSSESMLNAVMLPMMDTTASPVLDALDIAGYNYASKRYPMEGNLHPERIIVGSETFPFQLAENWKMVEELPYLIGDFMWTAWDYIGEIGLGSWYYSDDANFANKEFPWHLNGGGALDINGNPTGEALLAKAIFTKDNKPYIGVQPLHKEPLIKSMWRGTNGIPSWSWQGCEGMTATVEVFTSAPSVKLYLNDKLVGEQEVKDYVATFEVPYEAGTLKAVTSGGEQTLTSATGKVGITIAPEKESYKVGELIYLDINLTGENGEVESKADRVLNVQVEGAKLLGFGSQTLITTHTFQSGIYPTAYGRSLAVLKAKQAGTVKVTVSGEGLDTATCTINLTGDK